MENPRRTGRLGYCRIIEDLLGRLVVQARLDAGSGLTDITKESERVFGTLLNLIHGWDLVSADSLQQNHPVFDLVDPGRQIGVVVTYSTTSVKVRDVLDKFQKYMLGDSYDRLIFMFISPDLPARSIDRYIADPGNAPACDFWNIPILMGSIQELELDAVIRIADYLKTEIEPIFAARKITLRPPDHPLPPVPALSDSFVEGSRDRDLTVLLKRLGEKYPIFLCGPAGIGKTQLAILLARRYGPIKGSYCLRYHPADEGDQDPLRQTILHADFANYPPYRPGQSDPEQEYQNRLALLRSEFDGALLIIDDFAPGQLTPYTLRRQSPLCSMNIQLVFTTRDPLGTRSYRVAPLEQSHLMELFRQQLSAPPPDAICRELIRAAKRNTLLVDMIAKTLASDSVTPNVILATLPNTGDTEPFDPQTLETCVKNLLWLFHHDEATQTVLRFATLLPDDGLDAAMFRSCLTTSQKYAMKSLIRMGQLKNEMGVLTLAPALRIKLIPDDYLHDGQIAAFLDKLWYTLDPEACDPITVRQLATCFSDIARRLDSPEKEYALRAARLWEFASDPVQARRCIVRFLEMITRTPEPDPQQIAACHIDIRRLNPNATRLKRYLDAEKYLSAHWPDHPDLIHLRYLIGCAYRDQGYPPPALEYLQRALDDATTYFSPDHPRIADIRQAIVQAEKRLTSTR